MLSHRDSIGFDFEQHALSIFECSGIAKYLIKKSPKDKVEWKSQRGHGVDFIFQIGNKVFPVECKWHMTDYPERVRWFDDDVQSRFWNIDGYFPKIVCTNRPQNYTTSEAIQSKSVGFYFLTIHQLVSYIKHLIVSNTVSRPLLIKTLLNESCVTYIVNSLVESLLNGLMGVRVVDFCNELEEYNDVIPFKSSIDRSIKEEAQYRISLQ